MLLAPTQRNHYFLAIAYSPMRQRITLALLSIALLALFGSADAYAQDGGSLRIPRVTLPDAAESAEAEEGAIEAASGAVTKWVIDTDTGVDDAAALVWFLSQRRYLAKVLGIVTVAGNTTEPNVANNVLLIINTLGQSAIPVIRGASAPWVVGLTSTVKLVHGPDGLWFVGQSNPQDLNQAQKISATNFYCKTGKEHPGAKILALGPLTDLAAAIRFCPQDIANYSEIVLLGTAKVGGTVLPDAEFNIWQDPHAAQVVFASSLAQPSRLSVVPLEAFTQFSLDTEDINKIANKGNAAAKLIAPALQTYIDVQSLTGGEPSVPDPAAAIYALDRKLGESQPALVRVINQPRLVRGKTVVGLTFNERVTMVIPDRILSAIIDANLFNPDLFAIIAAVMAKTPNSEDNAAFVVDILETTMKELFMEDLTKSQPLTAFAAEEELDVQIFLPFVASD